MAIRRRKRLFGMRRRIGKSLVPPTQVRLRVAVRLVETGGGVARPNRISRRERHYIEGGRFCCKVPGWSSLTTHQFTHAPHSRCTGSARPASVPPDRGGRGTSSVAARRLRV